MATDAADPASRIMAGAPVDISAAIAWAAKYVERNGFWVRQPPGSATVQEDSSRERTRRPAKAASGSVFHCHAQNPAPPRSRRRADSDRSLKVKSPPSSLLPLRAVRPPALELDAGVDDALDGGHVRQHGDDPERGH